ncbi:hypothetical protein [Neptunomonas marina]|uniref:DUF2157 domain-containing protein n=1 Tax=Neptunomonas marina TaxID=1815562 RepID=A0A437Q517_9GAMM|nr:hypothetical protein [Neptunomonas marina]RVU29590.1 hypothetical protein EOE65_15575 [Neptunomonas marina]
MYSDDDLNQAVDAGVLTAEDVGRFRSFISEQQHTQSVDEEHIRLVSGFNDIFVLIACALTLTALYFVTTALNDLLGSLLLAVGAWGLSEYFTKRRHMALPSIALLLAFTGAGFGVGWQLSGAIPDDLPARFMVASGIAAAAATLHWWRFQVPITIAAGTAALVAMIFSFVLVEFPDQEQLANLVMLSLGVGVFLFAMRWDISDLQRTTRRSDVAFWLHLLASPLIIHPIFLLAGVLEMDNSITAAVATLTIYLVIGLISLLVDRRALLVSALFYVIYTLSSLFENYGAIELNIALAAMVIGSLLLLLSVFWRNCREQLLRAAPATLLRYLPR